MILTYREGCSGSWFAELLTLNHNTRPVFFRQDRNNGMPNFPSNVLHFDGNIDSHVSDAKKKYSNQKIITCHNMNYGLLRETWPEKNIIRIHPVTGIFQCISASFHKMGLNNVNSVDLAFEYIKDYYEKYKTDVLPDVILNYGDLSNLEKLKPITRALGVELQDNHMQFANNYWSIQKFVVDDTKIYNGITKDNLLSIFSKEESIFNLACFIFVYEKYNSLLEIQRQWSIDFVPNNLIELATVMKYGPLH